MLNKQNKNPLKIELFNLRTDRAEANDVADEHPEIVQKMAAIMQSAHEPSQLFPFKPLDDLKR